MNKARTWLDLAQALWASLLTLFFLLNFDQFASAAGVGPEPKFWIVGAFLLTVALYLPGLRLSNLLSRPLAIWLVAYLVVSAAWIAPADSLDAALDGFVLVVTTVLFVLMALIAYPRMTSYARLWSATLWLALVLAVASVLHEYFSPSAYIFAETGLGISGRGAGLYLNPTIAAQAVVMILACLLVRCSRNMAVLAVAIALVGLLPTFSRGGFLAWAALVVVATLYGRLPRWFLASLLALIIGLTVAGGWLFDAISVWVDPENLNSLDRLAWMLGQGSLSDYSADERQFIARYALSQFAEAPVTGHGLGSMWVWSASVGAHNMILRNMVEYGAIGILIFPSFLAASALSAKERGGASWRWSMGGIALLLSVFSHNMTEQASFLLPWLAVCLIAPPSERAVNQVAT